MHVPHSVPVRLCASLFLLLSCPIPAAPLWADGSVRFVVTDAADRPLPARVHLRDAAGQAVKSLGLTDRLDHLLVDGSRTVDVPAGTYTYGIERSPEWERVAGELTVGDGETKAVAVSLRRIIDLTKMGWYSGDLHIHRPPDQIRDLMRASDLHVGPVITWWNNRNYWADRSLPNEPLIQFDGNRFAHLVSGEDEREGGALLYFGMNRPIDISGSGREFPSPLTFVKQAREQTPDLHLDVEKPFWWDVPVWLALAKPDTIGLANNHMCRDRMYETEAWGRPRDESRLPAPRGNGHWTQEIYYHILNAGFRVPPSAGSASGVLPNAVGYNRVYVKVNGEVTWEKWWEGLRAGRSFVTNGPVLDVSASMVPVGGFGLPVQMLPGNVFRAERGEELTITILAELWKQDNVPALELIQNGRRVGIVRCGDAEHETRQFTLQVDESGWFLVRAITDNPRTFRFASSAPFYVEIDDQPRISRASSRFFLEWVRERIARVPNKIPDDEQRETVLRFHHEAEEFWLQRLDRANAD